MPKSEPTEIAPQASGESHAQTDSLNQQAGSANDPRHAQNWGVHSHTTNRSKRLIKKLLKRVVRLDLTSYYRWTSDGKRISDKEVINARI